VRGRVDAAGQTGGDGEAGAADARCEQAGELLAGRRPVARPDDGQRRPQQLAEVAFGVEQWRRPGQHRQRRRIAGLDGEQRARADAVGCFQLRLGIGSCTDAQTVAAAASG
jgi:hypothetical protein